jgi:alkylresorcinol/alkylpyrone synthase
MRYIHRIFAPLLGEEWPNSRLLAVFEPHIERLELEPDARAKLRDFVRFQLVGERSRRALTPWHEERITFQQRAAGFEAGTETALDVLAEEILPAIREAGVVFDAVIGTTATGNLMPGISYRMAGRLGEHVRTDTTLIDLANVGCTGSSKALHLARAMEGALANVLLVAVEVPSTLSDVTTTRPDIWQGNCTFGDGAAAVWISSNPALGPAAFAVEELRYKQWADTGLDLIRWEYNDYYNFALRDEKTFERDVRQYVVDALQETEAGWKDEPRWAIHPAGITLLVRLSRKLGIPSEAIQPSVQHYRRHSNMSSASVLHILHRLMGDTEPGAAINLLTMGAGFNVVYGRIRRER